MLVRKVMHDLPALLRRGDRAAAGAVLAALAPALSIGPVRRTPSVGAPRDREALARITDEGLGVLEKVALDEMAALSDAVRALVATGLPAVFVYAFAETWALAERVRARISAAMATEYSVVEDAWAWQIDPGERGWPPHRGVGMLLERSAPELLNVWVALTDATADRACMYFVPLRDDPGYPSALEHVDAPLEVIRAVPVRAADALFWNANVLHWGGPCSALAGGPRRSCSYTLARGDAPPSLTGPILDPVGLDLDARLDVIARQIIMYGAGKPDVSAEIRTWAEATCALGAMAGRKDL